MSDQRQDYSFWDLVESAIADEGVRKLHLTVGRPPMIRRAEGELLPLQEDLPILTPNAIAVMLARVIQPEAWEVAEQNGDGNLTLSSGGGRRISLTFFKSNGNWSAIVHF